jgi:hypothetical protein
MLQEGLVSPQPKGLLQMELWEVFEVDKSITRLEHLVSPTERRNLSCGDLGLMNGFRKLCLLWFLQFPLALQVRFEMSKYYVFSSLDSHSLLQLNTSDASTILLIYLSPLSAAKILNFPLPTC